MTRAEPGPVLFAYDGSDLAGAAIAEAGRNCAPGATHSSSPSGNRSTSGSSRWTRWSSTRPRSMRSGRRPSRLPRTGRRWLRRPDSGPTSTAAEAAPTWQGIIDAADQHDASLIVLGSHGRSGLAGAVVGSVAGAVAAHSRRSVLIVHRH